MSLNERSWKHVEIREHVRRLVDGARPGTAAPSERDLVEHFGVARMTVRQAIESLVSEGLLERVPGRGTFVADPRRRPTGVVGFAEEFGLLPGAVESRSLVVRRVLAPAALAGVLGVPVESAVVHWRRLRLVEGRPVCLADTWLPDALIPDLLDAPPSSLYAALAARGRRPDRADDTVTARVATAEEADLLAVAPATPVLCRQRRASCGDEVVEVTREVRSVEGPPLRLHLVEGARAV